jgi:hypothetical protein
MKFTEYKVSVIEYLLAPYKHMPRTKKATVSLSPETPSIPNTPVVVNLTTKEKALAFWNKHAWSLFATFMATFLTATVPLIDTLGKADVERGFVIAIIIAGVRAGIKAIIEAIVKNKF